MGKIIVVAGATGLQGRAVTAHLLAGGRRVRALTRDPGSASAQALAAAGAELVRAEMEDLSPARRIHPGLMDLRTWLERTGAAQIEAFFEARQNA
ncbi:NmrA family NAD(P)-binding protein [Streptosporangium sp. NPDC023825]|uniref:NmrA family NAD(P)-binding protein n=1 Tax=Streptosporangium sp. NPDC023825 TaxID=3154909 RepID=UPI00343857BC